MPQRRLLLLILLLLLSSVVLVAVVVDGLQFQTNPFSFNSRPSVDRTTPPIDDDLRIPTLDDWTVDRRTGRITGIVYGHPVVPDGETLTTAPCPKNGGTERKPDTIVSTTKGTRYRLLDPKQPRRGLFATTTGAVKSPRPKPPTTRPPNTGFYYSTQLPFQEQIRFLEDLSRTVRTLDEQQQQQKQQKQPRKPQSTNTNDPTNPRRGKQVGMVSCSRV
jgi:hypothetical protein